jgi:hypothetical protein
MRCRFIRAVVPAFAAILLAALLAGGAPPPASKGPGPHAAPEPDPRGHSYRHSNAAKRHPYSRDAAAAPPGDRQRTRRWLSSPRPTSLALGCARRATSG